MREYKFRGMTKLSTWQFGYLTDYQTKHTVTNESGGEFFINGHEVIPKTIGQYTEFTSLDDTEIYEGDKIRYKGRTYDIVMHEGQYIGIPMGAEDYTPLSIAELSVGIIVGNIHEEEK